MIDIRTYGANPNGTTDASAAIQSAINADDILIKDGLFLISESIKIPSNRTVYGQNAKLKMANESYDNAFRNSDWVNGNVNVNIIGLKNFVIDCNGTNNDDDYTTHGGKGETESYKYVAIQMYKVTGFELSNLIFADTPHHTIHINQSGGTVLVPAVIKDIYLNIKKLTVNQDGIDITYGSHYINITNIAGHTQDDFLIFANGVYSDLMASYASGYNVGDVHNVTVNGMTVKNSLNGNLPALLCGNGNKIHDISIQNVIALRSGCALFSNYGAPYVGTAPSVDDVYNIIGDNITINTLPVAGAAFIFGQSIKNSAWTNITNNSGKNLVSKLAGTQQNVSINGSAI